MFALLTWLLIRPPALALAALLRAFVRWRLRASAVVELSVGGPPTPGGLAAVAAFERFCAEPGVREVVLRVRPGPQGWSTLAEWREALLRTRGLGRRVTATLTEADNRALFLASAANEVRVAPLTEVGLVGVGGYLRFFGAALERWGLSFDMEAAGAYKSFGESFTRTHPSRESREALQSIVDDLHGQLVAAVATGRGLNEEAVREAMAVAPLSAEEALRRGLVDGVGWPDEVEEAQRQRMGDRPRVVRWPTVLASAWAGRLELVGLGAPRVVVVHLQGAVSPDEPRSRGPRIAHADVAPVLRALREDDRVAGCVLVVQSPGGSALASDLIWREVELLKRRRPVVAVLGDVAASGGYYIAAAASEIVARPGTLTGSIGVVGGKPVIGEALARQGVRGEWVAAAPNVGVYGLDRPFDEAQRRRFRERLDATYATFVRRVAAGRRRPEAAVEEVAQGRVWTGRQALGHGLVDSLGGLEEAVARVRRLAGVNPSTPWRRIDLVVGAPRGWLRLVPSLLAEDAKALLDLARARRLDRWELAAEALPAPLRLLAASPGQPLALALELVAGDADGPG